MEHWILLVGGSKKGLLFWAGVGVGVMTGMSTFNC